jgi:hypothetical protein
MALRPAPDETDVRVVVGDTHGDHVGLLLALGQVGALDERNVRVPGYWLCHIGDVIHAGHGVQDDDVTCLKLALDLFDCLLYGNHETPFAVDLGSFVGQNPTLDGQPLLDASVRAGRWQAATAVDGYLLTHAGLHPRLLAGSQALEPLRDVDRLHDPIAVAGAINDAFEQRIESGEPEPVFDWVGPLRSSRAREPCGGIFWCDWTELMAAERKPRLHSPLKQIVGHTLDATSSKHSTASTGAWMWGLRSRGTSAPSSRDQPTGTGSPSASATADAATAANPPDANARLQP